MSQEIDELEQMVHASNIPEGSDLKSLIRRIAERKAGPFSPQGTLDKKARDAQRKDDPFPAQYKQDWMDNPDMLPKNRSGR